MMSSTSLLATYLPRWYLSSSNKQMSSSMALPPSTSRPAWVWAQPLRQHRVQARVPTDRKPSRCSQGPCMACDCCVSYPASSGSPRSCPALHASTTGVDTAISSQAVPSRSADRAFTSLDGMQQGGEQVSLQRVACCLRSVGPQAGICTAAVAAAQAVAAQGARCRWAGQAISDLRNSSAASRSSQALALLQHRLSMGDSGALRLQRSLYCFQPSVDARRSRVAGWGCTVGVAATSA